MKVTYLTCDKCRRTSWRFDEAEVNALSYVDDLSLSGLPVIYENFENMLQYYNKTQP